MLVVCYDFRPLVLPSFGFRDDEYVNVMVIHILKYLIEFGKVETTDIQCCDCEVLLEWNFSFDCGDCWLYEVWHSYHVDNLVVVWVDLVLHPLQCWTFGVEPVWEFFAVSQEEFP
jgi:hypothetical protein